MTQLSPYFPTCSITGIMVIVYGMLSRMAEKKAENHKMTSMAAIWRGDITKGKMVRGHAAGKALK